jgi:hypothetical protein
MRVVSATSSYVENISCVHHRLLVNCHALETIIASYAVPNEMNPVVVIGFHPDGRWNWISALSAGIVGWKLV